MPVFSTDLYCRTYPIQKKADQLGDGGMAAATSFLPWEKALGYRKVPLVPFWLSMKVVLITRWNFR
jgi:hypothetical protein